MFNPSQCIEEALRQKIPTIPIIDAIAGNKLKEVERLLNEGVDVNLTVRGANKTLLHFAVEFNHADIVALLIEKKANVHAITTGKFTSLHVAAQQNNVEIIELLVKAGGVVNALSNVGCTPLHEAAAKGHDEAVFKLLDLNADPNIKDSRYNLTAANLANENLHFLTRDILVSVMTYQQRFIQNVNSILFKCTWMFKENSLGYKFILDLSKSIKSLEEGDEVFKKISEVFNSTDYKKIDTSLSLVSVRQLMIKNMKQYNQDKLSYANKSTANKLSSNEYKGVLFQTPSIQQGNVQHVEPIKQFKK